MVGYNIYDQIEEKLKLKNLSAFYSNILRGGGRMGKRKINVHLTKLHFLFLFFLQDPLIHLPEDVITRTYNIFAIMFHYAVEILTWEKESELPADLEMV